jgi:hypothetical protein
VRLRSKRSRSPQPEPSPISVADVREVDTTPPVLWSVEQLNALRPVTGPSHRTFVPIVRNTMPENSLGDLAEA